MLVVVPETMLTTHGLLPSNNSLTAQRNDGGAPMPPSSSGRLILHQSDFMRASNDLRNDSGIVTVRATGSYTGG
jgi:hypothetical protein